MPGLKTLICDQDLRNGALCSECMRKVKNGEISSLEVDVSRKLHELDKKFIFMNVSLEKAIELDNLVVLVCTGKLGQLIGKGGRNIAELGKKLGKRCRVIEKSKDEKKMIQDLIGKARVLGVNKVFKEGNIALTVVLSKEDEKNLIFNKESLEKALEKIIGNEARIEFV